MNELLKRGGIEFLAVFLGIALSLWVDQYQKSKAESLNNQILSRLYPNLKADSVDEVWNSNAHRAAMIGSKKVIQWCDDNQPTMDSIDIFISSMAIRTIFVNNKEEYNALKSSGRMELIKNEELIRSLHDYYTIVDFIRQSDRAIQNKVNNHFVPFISNYADFYGKDSTKIVYDVYPVFNIIKNPNKFKLKFFASTKYSTSKRMYKRYEGIVKDVTAIRKMIRKELKN